MAAPAVDVDALAGERDHRENGAFRGLGSGVLRLAGFGLALLVLAALLLRTLRVAPPLALVIAGAALLVSVPGPEPRLGLRAHGQCGHETDRGKQHGNDTNPAMLRGLTRLHGHD